MNIVKHDPLFSWFGRLPWIARYLLMVAVVYIPMIICTINDGTFNSTEICDLSFVDDYTFHTSWISAIPIFMTILPWFFSEIEHALECLFDHPNVTPFFNSDMKNMLSRVQFGVKFPLAGSLIGVVSAAAIAIINIRSVSHLVATTETKYLWWLPSGKFCGATVVLLVLAGMMAAIAVTVKYSPLSRQKDREVKQFYCASPCVLLVTP